MRVLGLFSHGFGGHAGIAEFNRRFMTAAVASDAVDRFESIALGGQDAPRNVATGITPLNTRPLSRIAFSLLAFGWALAMRPDLIVCGHIHYLTVASAAARAGSAKLWLIVHGIDAWQCPGVRFIDWGLDRVDRVLAVSRVTRKRMLRWSGLSSKRISVLPNTIDLSRFTPGDKPEYLKSRYGIQNRRVLFTLSRLSDTVPYKGHEAVIRALRTLLKQGHDLVYLIGGDGHNRHRFEALVADLGLRDRVIFTGRVPEAEKVDHYRLADVYAMPGRGEGFGIAYLEAMACGIPVVGSLLDGSRDALCDGSLGILVNPDNPRDVVGGLSAALDRPRGRPHGLEIFDLVHYAACLDEYLRACLNTPSKTR